MADTCIVLKAENTYDKNREWKKRRKVSQSEGDGAREGKEKE